ncbi:MAG: hypothetical protein LBK95_11505 [Bifidobacteriaceae bacterium]|jgi:hypothetical protein|nr:hypothetical protein [Bifidobacteriaceae bacterium]
MPATPAIPARYAGLVPYDTPRSLDALHGPTSGSIEVESNISTAFKRTYEVGDPARCHSLYQATVRDGYAHQQEAILDKATLFELWRGLWLPKRCRDTWETKFPELAEL